MGEMARPPKLLGSIPKVRADWQWAGEWWVETDAVLVGAWRLPQEGKLALLFVNVSDQPVIVTVAFDGRTYGFQQPMVTVTELRAEGKGRVKNCPLISATPCLYRPERHWRGKSLPAEPFACP